MKIERVLFPSVFFKIKDPFDGRSFLVCSHDPFFQPNKNRILKNGSCEQALIIQFSESSNFKQSYFVADETRDFPCIPVLPENFQSAMSVF